MFRDIQKFAKQGLLHDCFSDEVFAALMERFKSVSEEQFDWTEHSATPYSNEYCLELLEIFDFYNDRLAEDICTHVAKLKELWRTKISSVAMAGGRSTGRQKAPPSATSVSPRHTTAAREGELLNTLPLAMPGIWDWAIQNL